MPFDKMQKSGSGSDSLRMIYKVIGMIENESYEKLPS
eukprot:CAMPEP_0185767214 /NCGR_PEP_ID=MMETSP1174-20130828/41823_1 /TAXON_ID=35687 /ORGANISM="Dictyocha speculum, Strain CCMP1381" /LENGTH=36 /DNA_ID= /DNA_START= /DNA_END= /DNA_ORIENTATION=